MREDVCGSAFLLLYFFAYIKEKKNNGKKYKNKVFGNCDCYYFDLNTPL